MEAAIERREGYPLKGEDYEMWLLYGRKRRQFLRDYLKLYI